MSYINQTNKGIKRKIEQNGKIALSDFKYITNWKKL